jgi:hypothetical protein
VKSVVLKSRFIQKQRVSTGIGMETNEPNRSRMMLTNIQPRGPIRGRTGRAVENMTNEKGFVRRVGAEAAKSAKRTVAFQASRVVELI